MKTRWIIAIAAVGAFVVMILISIIHHYQLRAATETYIAELKAKGEPMDLAQVIPPPVPPEKNSAPIVTNALSRIYMLGNNFASYTNLIIFNNPPSDLNRTMPGRELIGWQLPVIHEAGGNRPTNTWDDLGAQLLKNQNDLDDFRQLIAKPVLYFDYDYSNPERYIPALAPHLSQFKLAIQWLQASEFYNLHQGKTAAACMDVRAMLAFVKAGTEERFEISQLIRIAIAQMSADATWNVLQATNVSSENLAALQQDWQSLQFIEPMRKAFLFERIGGLQMLNGLRKSPTDLDSEAAWYSGMNKEQHYKQTANGTYVLDDERPIFQKMKDGVAAQWDKFQWRWFESYTDEIRGLQMWQTIIEGTQMMGKNHSFLLTQSFVDTNYVQLGFDPVKTGPYAIFSHDANQIPALRRMAEMEISRNIVITAIALKRYQLQYQKFPATLEELVPDFLKSVPADYMDGKPLRYRRNADGTFLLYSIGENGRDDGGDPSLEKGVESSNFYWQNPHALDWVWPQPATQIEIQKYDEEQFHK